jgi:uncharacterized lipoprotein YmbA
VNDIAAPVKTITFGTASTDPTMGKIAAITRMPERHLLVTCANRATNQCYILDYNKAATTAKMATINLVGVQPTDVDAISKINVATFPQGDWIVFTANDKLLLYNYPGS